MRIFGREPALWLALVAAMIQLFSAFIWELSAEQQGVLGMVAVAVIGVLTAWSVARDKLAPAILGLVQAVLAAALAFGAELSSQDQATLMTFVAAVVGMFVRTQVTAKVAASTVDNSVKLAKE